MVKCSCGSLQVLSVVGLLQDETDPMVSVMKVCVLPNTLLALTLLQPSQVRAFLCKDANSKTARMSCHMSSHAPVDNVLMQDVSCLQSGLNTLHECITWVLGSAYARPGMTAVR